MDIRTILDACHFSREKIQKINLFATNELFLDLYCLEPGQKQKVHTHDTSSKIYIVLEGQARFHIAGETENAGPGQAVVARAGAASLAGVVLAALRPRRGAPLRRFLLLPVPRRR